MVGTQRVESTRCESVVPCAHGKADAIPTALKRGSQAEAGRRGWFVCPVLSRLLISFLRLKAGAWTAAPSPNHISGLS